MTRRILDPRTADELGALDADAVARVREEAWPRPESAEELHEALAWMGYVTAAEAEPWRAWLDELAAAGRVVRDGERCFAVEATREPKAVLRGRLEALGPVFVETGSDDEALLLQLEAEGAVLRARIEGRPAWCDRRLLARIHRYTLDRLRREIEPVTAAEFLRFLSCWQHVDPDYRLDGPAGVAEVVEQLAGFEVPAAAWEGSILPWRVRGYKREWLDQLAMSGEVVWGRLWGAAQSPVRRTPIALVPRADLDAWTSLAAATVRPAPGPTAEEVLAVLRARGAVFVQELARACRLPLASVEEGLGSLVAQGRVTCDSFGGLRWLLLPASRRRGAGCVERPLEPARRRSGPALRREPGRVRGAPAAAAHGRRLPPHDAARAHPGAVARRGARVPPARGARRGARRALRRRLRRRAVRAARGGDAAARACAARPARPLGGDNFALPASDPLNFNGILTPQTAPAATVHGVRDVATAIGS